MLLARPTAHRRTAHPRGRALLWAPFVVLGFVVAALMSRRQRHRHGFWRLSASTGPRQGSARRERFGRQRLSELRGAVIGHDRDAVQKLFGPPPAVAGSNDAPTWYYPLDPVQRRVMAIEF